MHDICGRSELWALVPNKPTVSVDVKQHFIMIIFVDLIIFLNRTSRTAAAKLLMVCVCVWNAESVHEVRLGLGGFTNTSQRPIKSWV